VNADTASRLDCCSDYASRGGAGTRRNHLGPWSADAIGAFRLEPQPRDADRSSDPGRKLRSRAQAAITIAFLPGRRRRIVRRKAAATVFSNRYVLMMG
jgi:hypothetical protein